MIARWVVGASVGVVLLSGNAWGQAAEPAGGVIVFQFDRPGVAVTHFVMTIHENGSARYQAEQAAVAAQNGASRGQAAAQIDRSFHVSQPTTARLFQEARALNFFGVTCASKRHVANMGEKTLTYKGPDGKGSCAYNYSEDKTVQSMTATIQGIAYTLDEGRKLDYLHRYDRLGLDEEMNFLEQEAADGHAQELPTISSTLSSLVEDEAILERVRQKAKRLLEQPGVAGTSALH